MTVPPQEQALPFVSDLLCALGCGTSGREEGCSFALPCFRLAGRDTWGGQPERGAAPPPAWVDLGKEKCQGPRNTKYVAGAVSETARFRANLKEKTACKDAVRFLLSPLRFNLFHFKEGNFLC